MGTILTKGKKQNEKHARNLKEKQRAGNTQQVRQIEDFRTKVSEYDPNKSQSGTGYIPQKISIRMFGKLGHGKSTFINNCLCVIKDVDYENQAGECVSVSGAISNLVKACYLTTKVEIVDNRGFKNLNPRELHECNMQMDGVRETNTQFRNYGWSSWAWALDQRKGRTREWSETIQVPVYIYKADAPRISSEMDNFRQFADNAYYYTGIYPIVVLMFAGKMEQQLETLKGYFGQFHCTDVFPIKNYHEKAPERNIETDTVILKIILKCLNRADDIIRRIHPSDTKPTWFD